MTRVCGTCSSLLQMLAKVRLTPEERTILLERSRQSIEESTRIMDDRLLRMPIQTDKIQ